MKLSIWIAFGLSLLFSSLNVGAQNFEVAPTRLDYNLEPGQNGQMFLNVKNHSDIKKSYTVSISDFKVDSEGQITYMKAGTNEKSVSDWVTINPSLFELMPNESSKISVILKVPGGEQGNMTKWGMLFIQEVTEKNETIGGDKSTSAGITVNPSIGVYVIQSPANSQNESATITNLREVEKNKIVAADAENTGDKILSAKAYLIISNLQTAEEQTLEPFEFTLLPGVKKTVNFDLPELTKGNYSFTVVLDYSPNKDLEGAMLDYVVE